MRGSGILLHISSLPSPHGIGTLGRAAYEFADFLHASKQKFWQILPLGPTGFGDSPYQSFSTNAGNPYFIDLDLLVADGLLQPRDCLGFWGKSTSRVDYSLMYERRYKLLRKAFEAFDLKAEAYSAFCSKNASWLGDYALFMAIKSGLGGLSWHDWPGVLSTRRPAAMREAELQYSAEAEFHKFLQYEFFKQWFALKRYVNSLGIKIIGDLPIYVADDSVDVWVNPQLFDLDDSLRPRLVSGVPPDSFSDDGQLWGNPVYNWAAHLRTGYRWWADRLTAATKIYDTVRIDHFRGFDSYFAIDPTETTARNGRWLKGPGIELFKTVLPQLDNPSFIAEDLGLLTDSVKQLLAESGFPGMRVIEFGFDGADSQSPYLPHNFNTNCVVYAGTHDNRPLVPWFKSLSAGEKRFCLDYLGCKTGQDIGFKIIRLMQRSVADTCIMQMQDLLRLGDESRMNTPSALGGNWEWRINKSSLTPALSSAIERIIALYSREPQKEQQ